MTDDPHDLDGGRPRADEKRSHEWYDDEFCRGGGALVGRTKSQVACPVCGELMDVDKEGYLFKHRPRIPKDVREV